MSHARIGRIRMKNGGAEVRLIRQETPDHNGENYRGRIVEHAKMIADKHDEASPLVGFVIIGLFGDGGFSTGVRWDDDRSPVPRTLFPTYIAEILRTELLLEPRAETIACDVFNRANGWPTS